MFCQSFKLLLLPFLRQRLCSASPTLTVTGSPLLCPCLGLRASPLLLCISVLEVRILFKKSLNITQETSHWLPIFEFSKICMWFWYKSLSKPRTQTQAAPRHWSSPLQIFLGTLYSPLGLTNILTSSASPSFLDGILPEFSFDR